MTTEKFKFPSINGLRAISIILVLIDHTSFKSDIFEPLVPVRWIQPLVLFIQNGQLGVNVFFVLSGFLITSLLINEESKNGSISVKNFYIRRTLRIFPVYFTMLAVYAIMQGLHYITIPSESWITALTYTKYFNWNVEWLTAHAWSLSIEEHFYLFWPFIFMSGPKTRKKLAIALVIMVPVLRTILYFHPVSWINELTLFLRIDAIAVGCVVAMYKDKLIAVMQKHWNALFIFALLSIFVLCSIPLIKNRINIDCITIPFGLSYGSLSNYFIAIILMYSVFGPKGKWFQILNTKVMNYIGLLSYSIYIWQQMFFERSEHWYHHFPYNILIIFSIATTSYYLVEKPFLTLKSKFSKSN